jgi:tetratricopeptide (TPR) repeat protein
MLGLYAINDYTGRHSDWTRLVREVVPDYVDLQTDEPLGGRDAEWPFVMSWRMDLARHERNDIEAERLQRLLLDWERRLCEPALAVAPETLDAQQRMDIRNLATDESKLGTILLRRNDPDCVTSFERSMQLATQIDDNNGRANAAFNLGQAFVHVSLIRDLTRAEHWYRQGIDLAEAGNRDLPARCLTELGNVALARLQTANEAKAPIPERDALLDQALRLYLEALDSFGENSSVDDRLVGRTQLCVLLNNAGRSDLALPHCREALRLAESSRDTFDAAGARINMARALAQTQRYHDALAYAETAKRQFESYGDSATSHIRTLERMIDQINQAVRAADG